MRIFPVVLLLFVLGGWANADSALRWDRKMVETQAAPGEKTVRTEFGFTNVSKGPVVIDSVRSSCGCTTASIDKKTYLPGEKGQITAIFSPGSHKGTLVKAIKVTVKGESEPVILTLVAHVGEAVAIDPPMVFWKKGDAPRPQVIRVKTPAEAGLRLVRVVSSQPRITAKLQPVKEGAEYAITVVPLGTNERVMAVLKIQAVTRSNEAKEFQAYAQVK